MPAVEGALVAIVRDFCQADRLLREILGSFRDDALPFAALTALVGDDDSSVLYRLKERSHALFRVGGVGGAVRREALFDLAVGSLFHEAMSFRENFYQREVYGPKVRALRAAGDGENDALFEEFEKILATADSRLRDGHAELEALLGRTRDQLLSMLLESRENGALARYLIEQRESVEAVFERPLPELMAELYGSVAVGFELAGRSYLATGYYPEAERALQQAAGEGSASELAALRACALGFQAFLAGDFAESLEQLRRWWQAGAESAEQGLAALAAAATARIARHADVEGKRELAGAAHRLELAIRETLPTPSRPAG